MLSAVCVCVVSRAWLPPHTAGGGECCSSVLSLLHSGVLHSLSLPLSTLPLSTLGGEAIREREERRCREGAPRQQVGQMERRGEWCSEGGSVLSGVTGHADV